MNKLIEKCFIKTKDINIEKKFKRKTPSEIKMERVRKYYKENGKFDDPILLDVKNTLIDGYIRYLIALENNLEEVECCKAKMFPCVKGYFYDTNGTKRNNIWLIKNQNIKKGDIINTKLGEIHIKTLFWSDNLWLQNEQNYLEDMILEG